MQDNKIFKPKEDGGCYEILILKISPRTITHTLHLRAVFRKCERLACARTSAWGREAEIFFYTPTAYFYMIMIEHNIRLLL